MPEALSIYRGYSAHAGLGEWPTDTPGAARGEQYLHADSDLWRQAGVANAARPWMTLYDDQQMTDLGYRLSEKIEGWSYFGYGELRFLVRLVSGGEFTDRLAYFSHGQAWKVEAFQDGFDPGALLGRAEAFQPSWRDGQPFPKVPEVAPEMKWRDLVTNRESAAVLLLAQLYRACTTNCPVVMGIPSSEFTAGSWVHQLVAFARASLPFRLKRDCRIRVLTGRPEVYLGELQAHLVVIPQDLADRALRQRRDAALLDMNCERRAGPEADPAYLGYAKQVVQRVRRLEKYPNALFRFTQQLDFPLDRPPTAGQVGNVYALYMKAAAVGNQTRMDGLLGYLFDEGDRPEAPHDWSANALIRTEEWSQFSRKKLEDLALMLTEKPGRGMLRDGSRTEVKRQGVTLDEPAGKWIDQLPEDKQSREILDLIKAGLVSRACALRLLLKVSPRQFDELMEDDENADLVAEILSQGEIADDLASLIQRADHVRRLIRIAKANPARRPAVDAIVKSMAIHQKVPAGLEEIDLRALPMPVPLPQLENYLNWVEASVLAGSKTGKERIKTLESSLQELDSRRRLFGALDAPQWNVLREFFRLPESWDADVSDLLVESRGQLATISTRRVLRALGQTQNLPAHITGLLDERMVRRGEETTKLLIQTGMWMAWRSASRDGILTGLVFRDSAKTWLLSESADPQLEEWKQVMLDLETVSAEDFQQLRAGSQGRKPPWPQIPLRGQAQLADLAERCSDLGVAAELAEAAGGGEPVYGQILDYYRLTHGVPASISAQAFFGLSGSVASSVGLEEAESLLPLAGHRKAQALSVLGGAVLHHLKEWPGDAEAAANNANLWNELSFQRKVADWAPKHLSDLDSPANQTAAALLDRHIDTSWQPITMGDARLEKLARLCASWQLTRLADFLWPDLYRKLAYALADGDASDPAWRRMVEQKNIDFATLNLHPLTLLAQKIMELPRAQQEQLDRNNGWATFKKVCRNDPRMSALFGHSRGGVALVHLAAVLRNDAGLGAVARGLFSLEGINRNFGDAQWWSAFFDSMESCQRRSAMLGMTDDLEAAWALLRPALIKLKARAGIYELEKRTMERYSAAWSQPDGIAQARSGAQ